MPNFCQNIKLKKKKKKFINKIGIENQIKNDQSEKNFPNTSRKSFSNEKTFTNQNVTNYLRFIKVKIENIKLKNQIEKNTEKLQNNEEITKIYIVNIILFKNFNTKQKLLN